MKILHIISSGGMYGAETVILNMSRTLNETGHCSILGVFENTSNPNLQLHEQAKKESIESHVIPCDGQVDRTVRGSIQKLAAKTRADIIHAHGYKADVYVYLALRRSDYPLISTCHNWINQDPMVSFYGFVDRLILRKYSAVVAVSNEVRNRLLGAGVCENKVYLIRNGIDLRPFESAVPSLRGGIAPETAPIVGWVGRLSNEKGADIFLHAAALVLIQVPHAQFLLVGEGPEEINLEALIDELSIRPSVTLVGRRDDMPSVYASMDVMVSSSRQEGLPMAILEAMAAGLPLVASAVGEVPTVVLNDRTGVLVKEEDASVLAAGIVELLGDYSKRVRFGSTARQLVAAEYSAERMAADYLAVYEDAITVKSREGSRLNSSPKPNGNTK